MKTRKEPALTPRLLRLEFLESRELLSAAPWSAPVDSLDAQAVEVASAQLEQPVVDLSNAQLENAVSFLNTGVADHQFALSWDAIDGASTYSVKINRDGAWIQYNKGLTETSCVMNGLYPGKTYEIRVCAVNENGRLTGDYLQTSFAPVRVVRSVNKFVAGDELSVSVLGSDDASRDIVWYYATPEGDVEITEARGLLSYAPTNPKHDVKVVVTGTGLSEGSASETLFVYSGDYTVETNYDPASKTLQVQAPEVEGAVKYYIWKPAPSGNMAIYQRTTEPVFTVSNVKPGTTTNFRVTAYDAKGTVLNSKDFKFASVALNAPVKYEAGKTLDVAVGADPSLNYVLSWFYVTPNGDVEISEAKDQTSFIPDAATYPIKIVATPIAGSEGFCVSAPVEAIVAPYVPQFGINDPYVTTERSFVTTWNAVPGATRYGVQKLNASGAWVKITAFDVVDGEIVGDTSATLSEDGSQLSYSVNMVKIGVEETYRVLAIDAKGAVIEKAEFTYNPVGLTVENDAYDLANGAQTLRAVTVQGIDDSLQYQWYYSTNDDPTNWIVVDGAASAELVLSADDAAQNYNYKVIATDPNEDRQSVAFARAETLNAPTNLIRSVDAATGDLLLTWKADANLSADNFVVQYYRTDGEYSAWSDLTQGTIVANGDGTFSLAHVNGEKYQELRVRASDATGWSEWKTMIPVEYSPFRVNTLLDVVDANDGATSLREAVSYYLAEQAAGTLPDGAKVCFDPNVFTQENHTIVLDAATNFYIDSSLVVDATDLGFNVVLDASMLMNQLFTVSGAKGNAALAGLTLENASCSVASSGSFIVKAGATLTLSSFRIANSTGLFRGGVYVNNATLIIEDSKFDQNYAAITGSVISAVNSSTVVVSNTIFEQNYSYIYGGAVELNFRSTATFTNCSFLDNTSATHGGAVYVAGNSSATFVGGEFVGNATEAANGEALYVAVGSDASLADVAFESNTPADMGGAGAFNTTNLASIAILDVDAELLDFAFIELEDEITLF